MSHFLRAAAVGISLGMTACAIHPLPEDVTGVPTVAIVNKIRCEAAEAVQIGWDNWKNRVASQEELFNRSAIAYNFTFDITETNFVDATLDLTRIITNGTGTAAFSGGVDRTRQNTRTFTIVDHFKDLRDVNLRTQCAQFATGKNYVYPIIGKIGVGEMVDTFIALTFYEHLGTGNPSNGPPTMGDTIAFTTLIQNSLTPKIALTPIGPSLQVLDSNLAIKNSRNDVHRVLIGIAKCTNLNSCPATTGFAFTDAALAQQIVSNPQTRVGFLVSINGTNAADYAAAHTIEQMITRFELGKPTGTIIVPSP
jgi:hypothetical protein